MWQMYYRSPYANALPDKQKMLMEIIERQIIKKPIHIQPLKIQLNVQPTNTYWSVCGQHPKLFLLIQVLRAFRSGSIFLATWLLGAKTEPF